VGKLFATSSAQLFNNWKAWSEQNGERFESQCDFSQKLEARQYRKDHRREGAVFVGIALKAEQ
jgi:hypothetical protein